MARGSVCMRDMIPRWGTRVRYPSPLVSSRQEEKQNAAARSGWRASRREAAAARGASACSSPSAACSPLAVSPARRARLHRRDRRQRQQRRANPASADRRDRRQAARRSRRPTSTRPPRPPAARSATRRSRARTTSRRSSAAADYKTNPPTSGNHFPDWYEDGIYAPGDTPEPRACSCTRSSTAGSRSSTSRARRRPPSTELEALLAEHERRLPHAAVREHDRHDRADRRHGVGHSLTCPQMNDQGLRRDPDVPRRATSTRARRTSPRRGRLPPAAGLAAVEPVARRRHPRGAPRGCAGRAAARRARRTRGRARSARATAATRGR